MSQALYTSMGGISAAQSQLNVVSNNIANINTIGFKESNVTFQDIFSTTMTAGNAPTVMTGGRNPVQIGLGVQVGTVAKNFSAGTWTSTGKTTDMMIQGNGFFTVKSASGEVFLTKAGNFTFDANGDMVNAQGYKVVGADQLLGTTCSASNVHVPQKIVTRVSANDALASKSLTDLNGAQITKGTFILDVNDASGSKVGSVTINLDTTVDTSLAALTTSINNQLAAASAAATASAGHKTLEAGAYNTAAGLLSGGSLITDPAVVAALATAATERAAAGDAPLSPAITDAASATAAETAATNSANLKTAEAAAYTGTTAQCDATTGGTMKFIVDGVNTGSLEFVPGTSNFVMATQLGSAKIDSTTHTYTSKILDNVVDIEPVTSLDNAVSVSNYTIANDGSIETTYSNGDKMTIERNPTDSTFQFKYTTSTGIIIRGADVSVNPNVATPPNFQMQLSNVVNPEGLVSMGGNLFMPGPNAGDMIFTVGSAMGLGAIKSGGLEASNVDLSKQFSDMILSQRAVQANSRVFSTTSQIMQTLVMLGQ